MGKVKLFEAQVKKLLTGVDKLVSIIICSARPPKSATMPIKLIFFNQLCQMNFGNQIIQWYHKNKRDLPWRASKDPYVIWLSEIILQQTRVDQGIGYYRRFLKKYPTIKKLAKATEDDVLKLWQGLGYYSRARNPKDV